MVGQQPGHGDAYYGAYQRAAHVPALKACGKAELLLHYGGGAGDDGGIVTEENAAQRGDDAEEYDVSHIY